jgi:CBS domain-containing protein
VTVKVLDTISVVLRQKRGEIRSVDPDATVFDALEIMANNEIGALLVERAGELLGVISERDYARKIILMGRSSKQTRVREIMTSPAITITPDCTVDEAMCTMTEHRIRHLPVVGRDGKIVGIASIGDLVKWTIISHEKTIEQLENYIAGQA